MIHELKTDPAVFDAVKLGLKRCEIRRDDRGFQTGDGLYLRETQHSGLEMLNGAPLIYTGAVVMVHVLHILRGPVYGLHAGWVIMSIETAATECPGCAKRQLDAEMDDPRLAKRTSAPATHA